MSYNWKCCSFYPNNFGASALSCSTSCRPHGSVRVSTGLWKHVHCPVETRPQASGRQPNVHFLTTEAHKIDSKTSVFPTSLARSKEKLTRRFFIFLQYFRIS